MGKFKRALVVSDTHRNNDSLRQIASAFADVDYLFHLGDNVEDAVYLADNMRGVTVLNVKGNCDFMSDVPEFEEVSLMGNKIVLTHGHTLKVKYSYDRALYYAREREAKAILFGHTHTAYTEYVQGVWLVNPGSAGEGRRTPMSVAMLVISEDGVVPKILKLEDAKNGATGG